MVVMRLAQLWLPGTLAVASCLAVPIPAAAQTAAPAAGPAGQLTPRTSAASAATSAPAKEGTEVTLDRQALSLRDSKGYQVPLQLRPARSITVAATTEGILRSITAKPGEQVGVQVEVGRIDDTLARLNVAQAEAEVTLAEAELAAAKTSGKAEAIAVAEARVKVAKSHLEIQLQRLDQAALRAPFAGTVLRVHVSPGQYVRAGDAVLDLVDQSQLRVEIPIDRNTVRTGDVVTLKIEGRMAEAKVEAILPAAERFHPLRDIAESLASAESVIDNAQGQFQTGQSVFAPLIPRDVVTEVPTVAISNTGEGGRQVQVIRQHVVRNIPVSLLAPIGADRTYVSGSFAVGDELVVFSSQPLADGTEVRRKSPAAAGDEPDTAGKKPKVSF